MEEPRIGGEYFDLQQRFLFDGEELLELMPLNDFVNEMLDSFLEHLSVIKPADMDDDVKASILSEPMRELMNAEFAKTEVAKGNFDVLASGKTIAVIAPAFEEDSIDDEYDAFTHTLSNTLRLRGLPIAMTVIDIPDISELERLRSEDDECEEPVKLRPFGLGLVLEDVFIYNKEGEKEALPSDRVAIIPLNYPQLVLQKIEQ